MILTQITKDNKGWISFGIREYLEAPELIEVHYKDGLPNIWCGCTEDFVSPDFTICSHKKYLSKVFCSNSGLIIKSVLESQLRESFSIDRIEYLRSAFLDEVNRPSRRPARLPESSGTTGKPATLSITGLDKLKESLGLAVKNTSTFAEQFEAAADLYRDIKLRDRVDKAKKGSDASVGFLAMLQGKDLKFVDPPVARKKQSLEGKKPTEVIVDDIQDPPAPEPPKKPRNRFTEIDL